MSGQRNGSHGMSARRKRWRRGWTSGVLAAAGVNGGSGVSPEQVRSEQRLDRREGIRQAGYRW